MKDVNKMILIGRLGGDPIKRETKNGTSVVNFSMATSRKFLTDAEGSGGEGLTEVTQWHKVVVWGKLGETCAQNLKKGSPVYVEGSLRSHNYSDRDGKPKTAFEVYAESVSFLGAIKKPNESVLEEAVAESA